MTVAAVNVPNVTTIEDFDWSEDLNSPNTSGSVTISKAGYLVAFWWGDNSLGNEYFDDISTGWTILQYSTSKASNHVQCGVAYRQVTSAGSYSVEWTPETSQGAQLYIVALIDETEFDAAFTQALSLSVQHSSLLTVDAQLNVSVTLNNSDTVNASFMASATQSLQLIDSALINAVFNAPAVENLSMGDAYYYGGFLSGDVTESIALTGQTTAQGNYYAEMVNSLAIAHSNNASDHR